MAFDLEIRDGPASAPWDSPDIWTVPGNDPLGSPGSPIAGDDCYLYAKVRNNGSVDVTNAYVFYYICNPAVGVDRTSANRIGQSSVSLRAGEEADVLCLTPWPVQFVNEGHVCAIAEVSPESLPPSSPQFNVFADPKVAQRNLIILKPSTSNMLIESGFFFLPFEVHNTVADTTLYRITAKQGRTGELEELVPRYDGELVLPEEDGQLDPLGFVESDAAPDETQLEEAQPVIEVKLKPFTRKGYSLVGRIAGRAALAHVVQEAVDPPAGQEIGGLSVFVDMEE